MLSMERLRVLHAVARYRTLAAAASALHVTPSAVSQAMAKLERETGQRLLEPSGRGVRLTDAGAVLAGHAATLMTQLAVAQADLQASRGEVLGTLRIAAFPTAARSFVTPAIRSLSERYDKLVAELSELETEQSIPEVEADGIDIAVIEVWDNHPIAIGDSVRIRALTKDRVDVALPADHPLAGADTLSLADLAGLDWISAPRWSACTQWLANVLRAKGTEPAIRHHANEYPTQLALVAAGMGTAFIPRLGRGPMPDSVRVIEVVDSPARTVYAAWRADGGHRPALTAGVDALLCAANAQNSRPDGSSIPRNTS